MSLVASVKKCFVISESQEDPKNREFLRFIKAWLLILMLDLVLEVLAHYNGWSLGLIQPLKIKPIVDVEAYDDIEDSSMFPIALVQVPMRNEIEVYAQSVSTACQLDWPRDRFLIQVLDNSDEETLQLLIRSKISSWSQKGVNIGFNGTSGVWRIKAFEGSGGRLEKTAVEDMNIAVRAHLNGRKFIFLNNVKVLCELPESYEPYKKQQHRS
ncbi:hypothetical protein GIB67_003396 [Kingdonia uniflora]|uniref:Uncharacterized protein n=1 Tax=Kingdonia uniflora TaxID=39325 RepID=A0A7J7P9P3_9MAGN|nr:hypothetical protein GIB67_003396 [Kingdonia uniflora]